MLKRSRGEKTFHCLLHHGTAGADLYILEVVEMVTDNGVISSLIVFGIIAQSHSALVPTVLQYLDKLGNRPLP